MKQETPKTEETTPKTKKSNYVTEQELLQRFGILFENIKTQTELKTELAEYGYDDEEVGKGKLLYDKALSEYQKNIKETQEETSAHHNFIKKLDELSNVFSTDRKKARIIFKDQNDVLINLRLKGRVSQSISSILDDMRVFYTSLQQNQDFLAALNRLKVNEEHVNTQLQKLTDVEKSYAEYIKEKGESQQATRDKNQAIKDIEKWVREFYAIAKIALEDKPQLLESVGKLIRN